jgi:phosphoadenosine phosphosulfate reductase
VLIPSPRHTAEDLALWATYEEQDRVRATLAQFARGIDRAERALDAFVTGGDCYAGVSWGKDSVVVADMVARVCPRVPLVWVSLGAFNNPDCVLVRDAFLSLRPHVRYEEIVVEIPRDERGEREGTGVLEGGFREAKRRFGARHVSGVRKAESGARAVRMHRWGENSPNTSAPIGWWRTADVFAYLTSRELPVHPAYACLGGGQWDRERVRVSSIGGSRGQEFGRAEWEAQFYGSAQKSTT